MKLLLEEQKAKADELQLPTSEVQMNDIFNSREFCFFWVFEFAVTSDTQMYALRHKIIFNIPFFIFSYSDIFF